MNVGKKESQKNVNYTYIENGSKTICFMLSGTGYTYDKPLLYYATMLMIEKQFDIVQIHYSYGKELFDNELQYVAELIEADVDSVVTEVLKGANYEQIVFLGKSLGTIPLISKYIHDESYSKCKTILLTPLLKFDLFSDGVMNSSNEMLIVIGNEDSHYITEKIVKLQERANIDMLEIANANHSLEVEPTNTFRSLKEMSEVMEVIRTFI